MHLKTQACLQVSVVLYAIVSVTRAQPSGNLPGKRQLAPHATSAQPLTDQLSQASGQHGPVAAAAALQAHSKFFQDFFSVQLSPYKIEFGHVCEDPNRWEQRYERKDYKNHRDQGKVRWGDKHGGYGEHYWDFNHADHDHDHDHDQDDSDDEGSEVVPDYEESQETDSSRRKRNPKHVLEQIYTTPSAVVQKQLALYLDEVTGKIVDRKTGRLYKLEPID